MQRLSSWLLALVVCLTVWSSASSASAWCLFNCNYTKTKYPIVLAHGAIGFDQALGLVDYWYGINDGLKDGGATVYMTRVSPFNSTEARGEELLAQVQEILAATGAQKVNLVGHSQGGLDARYVAAVAPQLVASITTVGTAHTGSGPFDALSDVIGSPDAPAGGIIGFLDGALAAVYQLLTGGASDVDVRAAAQSLSYEGAQAFNTQFPAGLPTTACGNGPSQAGGIRLYSWSGTAVLTNALDLTDVLIGVVSFFNQGANDGFTERCSSHFGQVIRDDYFHNHLDQVNQLLGLRSPIAADPVSLFRTHANRLKQAGL